MPNNVHTIHIGNRILYLSPPGLLRGKVKLLSIFFRYVEKIVHIGNSPANPQQWHSQNTAVPITAAQTLTATIVPHGIHDCPIGVTQVAKYVPNSRGVLSHGNHHAIVCVVGRRENHNDSDGVQRKATTPPYRGNGSNA